MYHNWSINSGVPLAVVLTYGSTHAGFTLGLLIELLGLMGLFFGFRLTRHRHREFDA